MSSVAIRKGPMTGGNHGTGARHGRNREREREIPFSDLGVGSIYKNISDPEDICFSGIPGCGRDLPSTIRYDDDVLLLAQRSLSSGRNTIVGERDMTSTAGSVILPSSMFSKPLQGVRGVPFSRGIIRSHVSCMGKGNLSCPVCLCTPNNAANNVTSKVQMKNDVDDDEACELVRGAEIILGEDEDEIHAYLLKAVKNNNGIGVLILSDIFGFEDSATREFAYRVACNGYNVLVPDLFRGNPWKDGQGQSMLNDWLTKHPEERVAGDIATSVKWLVDKFIAAGMSKKLGAIGFCYGGKQLMKTLAKDKEGNFGTGVCFYGTNIDPSLASDIGVPVLFICGDNDPLCPVKVFTDVEKRIRGSRLVIYPDRGHGFAHRPQSQEEDEDAENAFSISRHWLLDFLVARNGL